MYCSTEGRLNTMKSQGSRPGSASSWRLRLSCKKKLNDSNTSENIANYFVKTKPVQEDSENASAQVCDDLEVSISESPYQNILAEMKPLLNNSRCEKSYFKAAEPVKCDAMKVGAATTAKLLSVKTQKAKKSRQITMTRLLEKRFRNGDTNGDHLQLALALSRSMQDSNYSSPKEKEEDLNVICHPVQGNTILEQFGFNSGRKLGAETSTTNDVFKKRKKSRYQYVTPVLFLRTYEDREKLIATKVSLLLSQENKSEANEFQQQATSLSSSYLRNLNESGVYKLNQLSHEDLKKKELFYLDNLKVPQSTCDSGYLLKDWKGIFGREATPPRDIKSFNQLESNENMLREEETPSGGVQPCLKTDSITSYHQSDMQDLQAHPAVIDKINSPAFKPPTTCLSPNLFDSDDDSVVSELNRSINKQLELSKRLISNFKSKSIFFNKSSSSKVDDDCKEKPTSCDNLSFSETLSAKRLEYKNRSGIQHFESFQDEPHDCCASSKPPTDFEGSPNFEFGTKTRENQALGTLEIMQDTAKTKNIEKLQDFYDLTGSSDEESPISYIQTVKSFNKTKSFECSAVLENDNSILCIESVLQSSNISRRPEKISASEETDSTDCELQISSTKVEEKNHSISFNSSMNSSCHSSKSNAELGKELTQETVSDEELLLTAEGCFKKTNSSTSELDEFSQESVYTCNEKIVSFLSDVNSAKKSRHNFTFVSESDENLSKRSDEDSQNKINPHSPQSAGCDSKNSLQASSNFKNFNSFSSTSDGNLSQKSFSDEELNYSSVYTKSANKSIINLEDSSSEEENVDNFCETATSNWNKLKTSNATELQSDSNNYKDIDCFDTDMEIVSDNVEDILTYKTPENKFNKHNDNLIIKTKDVTPMPNYFAMNTPEISKELQKFGIKNLKRRRGVEILHYIYDSMHPLISEQELGNIDGGCNPVKKRKKDNIMKSRKKLESKYNENNQRINKQSIELVGDLLQENESDLIFEKKQSTKLASCRVPLHIAWFNLVASHPEIKENILLYEPLQLEVLYSLLKEQGYKYCMKDLLTFLDKKCITIRTNQNKKKIVQDLIKVKAVALSP